MKRSALTAAALALAVATLAPAAQAAQPPADSAVGWLATELDNGLMPTKYLDTFTDPANPTWVTTDDYGLTIDTALSIAEVGGNGAVVRQIRTALAPALGNYVGTGGEVYSGATAKALVFAVEAGADPRAYGGYDLVARTSGQVITSGTSTGRIADTSIYGDYANVLGQTFAVRGLAATGGAHAGSATDFLLKQQCSAGYFRLYLNADKDAANQGCVDGDATGSAPDTDTTAFAVLALSELDSPSAAVTSALTKATAWLKGQQAADGSLGGGTSTEAANANSTGVAGWALAERGECLAAGKAAGWVKALQVPASATGPLADEAGAIAYDAAALAAGQSDGITDAAFDQWHRTTAQIAPVVDHLLSAAAAGVSAPKGFQQAGAKVDLTITGTGDGGRVCVSGPGIEGQRTLVGAASLVTTVTLPAATGTATYTVTTAAGQQQVAVDVLGKATLKPKAKKAKVKPGAKQVVKVKGLAAGEKVTVTVRGKKIASGKADAQGGYTAKFKVKGKKLAKKGKAKVWVTGEFADRSGKTTFKVTG